MWGGGGGGGLLGVGVGWGGVGGGGGGWGGLLGGGGADWATAVYPWEQLNVLSLCTANIFLPGMV